MESVGGFSRESGSTVDSFLYKKYSPAKKAVHPVGFKEVAVMYEYSIHRCNVGQHKYGDRKH